MAEQAKQQAIQDIKEDLEKHHKCFLAFREELNPTMDKLVNDWLMLRLVSLIV